MSGLFLNEASDVLGQTEDGLSAMEIQRVLTAFADDWNVTLPNPAGTGMNKRTALSTNLRPFSDEQKYKILLTLCDLPTGRLGNQEDRRKLKARIVAKFPHLRSNEIDDPELGQMANETFAWLAGFPSAQNAYREALAKRETGVYARNLLDDLRLSLESLLKAVLKNSISLEKQIPHLGRILKETGCSAELTNMVEKLIDYYSKYQNAYVKHDSKVNAEEVEFVVELTTAFMRHFVRIARRNTL